MTLLSGVAGGRDAGDGGLFIAFDSPHTSYMDRAQDWRDRREWLGRRRAPFINTPCLSGDDLPHPCRLPFPIIEWASAGSGSSYARKRTRSPSQSGRPIASAPLRQSVPCRVRVVLHMHSLASRVHGSRNTPVFVFITPHSIHPCIPDSRQQTAMAPHRRRLRY